MGLLPPLRFGARPLAGKTAKPKQPLLPMRTRISAGARQDNVGKVNRKLTVVQKTSQPLVRKVSRLLIGSKIRTLLMVWKTYLLCLWPFTVTTKFTMPKHEH